MEEVVGIDGWRIGNLSTTHLNHSSAMLSILGAPSSLTYACAALVQALADVAYDGHTAIQAMYVDDVKTVWEQLRGSDPRPVVLISDCPSKALVDLILSTRLPFLVVADDFEETAHELVEARGMPLPEMLRLVTQSYCSVDRSLDGDALVLTGKDVRRPLRQFLVQLAEHYRLEDPAAIAEKTFLRLGCEDGSHETIHDHLTKSGLRVTSPASRALRADAEGEALIRFMASQYDGVGWGHGGEVIVWPTSLFLDWDRPGQFLRGPIDMLGPARFIVCGPYFHLTVGEWDAEVVIEIVDNPSGNRLGVDVFSGDILGGVVMPLPDFGVFTFSIPFRVTDPFLAVELRFQLLEGAIEGRLALRASAFKKRTPRRQTEPVLEDADLRLSDRRGDRFTQV